MSTIASTLLAIAMIAVFALVIAGVKLLHRAEDRQRGVLMIIAALVILVNVLIWTLPMP